MTLQPKRTISLPCVICFQHRDKCRAGDEVTVLMTENDLKAGVCKEKIWPPDIATLPERLACAGIANTHRWVTEVCLHECAGLEQLSQVSQQHACFKAQALVVVKPCSQTCTHQL